MIITIDIKKHLKYYLDLLNLNNQYFDEYKKNLIIYYNSLKKNNKLFLNINLESNYKDNILKLSNTYTFNNCSKYNYVTSKYYSYNGLKIILNILNFNSNENKHDFIKNNIDHHVIFNNNKFKILLRSNINKNINYDNTYTYNDDSYKLIGCFIYINYSHKITKIKSNHELIGLVCDNNYYIYDSYNIITYDKWNIHNFKNYKINFYNDPVYESQSINNIYIKTLIYILID